MPRKKTAKNVVMVPWLSANWSREEGRFIQVGNSLLLSKVWHSLDGNSKHLYLCMAMESGGKPFVTLSRKSAQRKYGVSPSTYSRAIKQLIEKKFVKLDENIGRYESNKFWFINDWKPLGGQSVRVR